MCTNANHPAHNAGSNKFNATTTGDWNTEFDSSSDGTTKFNTN
jgi:hypothetical protein